MSEDDNPFENVPDDFVDAEVKRDMDVKGGAETAPAVKEPDEAPLPVDFRDLPLLPPEVANKGRLAMAAGFGFVLLAVVVYLGIVMHGDSRVYVFGISGMILSALFAFFFMLDDLRIRPLKITERGTKFIAGIIWALLSLLAFIMTSVLWANYESLAYLYIIVVLTNASFALFLYSMLWDE
jgi:hypothetical protein